MDNKPDNYKIIALLTFIDVILSANMLRLKNHRSWMPCDKIATSTEAVPSAA